MAIQAVSTQAAAGRRRAIVAVTWRASGRPQWWGLDADLAVAVGAVLAVVSLTTCGPGVTQLLSHLSMWV